jgi:hypothetical protein
MGPWLPSPVCPPTGYCVVVVEEVCWKVDCNAGEELMVWMLLAGIVAALAIVAGLLREIDTGKEGL